MNTKTDQMRLSTFYFDGDISFENNDIKIISGTLAVRLQALKDLLKTNFKDYYFYPLLGANLDSFIGRGIDLKLKTEMERVLTLSILDSELFEQNEFAIYSIINNNSIIFRIMLKEDTDEIIQVTYSTSIGITID